MILKEENKGDYFIRRDKEKKMNKRVGIILSGCGVKDGSEIHEAVITLLHLDKNGATTTFLAPNIEQSDVIDHHKQISLNEKRNVLVESHEVI